MSLLVQKNVGMKEKNILQAMSPQQFSIEVQLGAPLIDTKRTVQKCCTVSRKKDRREKRQL